MINAVRKREILSLSKKGASVMEQTYIGNERRASRRLRMNCTVIYRINEPVSTRFMLGEKDLGAKMIDISQGGMAMVTNYDIPTSTVLSMRFTVLKVHDEIVNFSGPVEITGEVRSNVLLDKSEHRLGIYFTKMKKLHLN